MSAKLRLKSHFQHGRQPPFVAPRRRTLFRGILAVASGWIMYEMPVRGGVLYSDNFEDRDPWELLYGERPPKACVAK